MDSSNEVKPHTLYSCAAKAMLSNAGSKSSSSTATPGSSRSLCSSYPESTAGSSVCTHAEFAMEEVSACAPQCSRTPLPKRLLPPVRLVPKQQSIPDQTRSRGVGPPPILAPWMTGTSSSLPSRFILEKEATTSYPRAGSIVGALPEEIASGEFAYEAEEIASGEFTLVQVAAHDVTVLHAMKEEPEEIDDSEPLKLVPTCRWQRQTSPRPFTHPACPPRELQEMKRYSPPPSSSGASSVATEVVLVPVRNTFIHYDSLTSFNTDHIAGSCEVKPKEPLNRWHSAPGVLLSRTWSTKYPKMEVAHNRGDCRPCAYVYHKEDGCRWGGDCKFCHLCPPGAMKKKKKEKVALLRAQEAAENQARFSVQEEVSS